MTARTTSGEGNRAAPSPLGAADMARATGLDSAARFASRVTFRAVFGAPLALWQGAFFLAPVGFMVMISFWTVQNYQITPSFNLDNWRKILSAYYFWDAFLRSLVGATIAAVAATVLAFPCAFYLGLKASPRARLLGGCLIMAPFFTSFLVRAYTWRTMLGEQGVVNALFAPFGLGPWQMTNNLFGSVMGYLTLTLPLVLLLQLFSIAAIDKRLIEAAQNLGCSAAQTVYRVVIPAALNGIVLAAAFAFVLSFGDLISPQVLGGSNPPTLSILIVDQVRGGLQWPRAAVIAIVMVATLLAIVSAAVALAYGGGRRSIGAE
jgi:spermidine/putrescine transport system permease protein/putrescine transport system permease protein